MSIKTKWVRVGECIRCGQCCSQCEYLIWITNRDVLNGETFSVTGINGPFMTICGEHGQSDRKKPECIDFPSDRWCTPPNCGFKWIEVDVEG